MVKNTIPIKVDLGKTVLQVDSNNKILQILTGPVDSHQAEGFSYPEVSSDLVKNSKILNVGRKYYRYRNGKVYMPITQVIKRLLDIISYKTKLKYKHSFMTDYIKMVIGSAIPYFILSCFSSVFVSFFSLLILKYNNDKVPFSEDSFISVDLFLSVFIPSLTIFMTLIGIYLTLRETRLLSLKQLHASVQPSLSISNIKKEEFDFEIRLEVARGGRTINSVFDLENVGLAVAQNIRFLHYASFTGEDETLLLDQVNVKKLKPEASSYFSLSLSDEYKGKEIKVYSVCEDVYGEAVFHVHSFFPQANLENLYHIRDRKVVKGSSEFKTLLNSLDFILNSYSIVTTK
jgi:hypothetical protein